MQTTDSPTDDDRFTDRLDAEVLFALYVTRERLRRGWSQRDLAERVSRTGMPIHATGITRLEREERSIRLNEVFAICEAFDVSVYDVLEFMRAMDKYGVLPKQEAAEAATLTEAADIAATMLAATQDMLAAAIERHRDLSPPSISMLKPLRNVVVRMGGEKSHQPEIVHVQPKNYDDAQTLGEHFRNNLPVLLDVGRMKDEEARRVVDFAAGLTFAMHGSIDRIGRTNFILTPSTVNLRDIVDIADAADA